MSRVFFTSDLHFGHRKLCTELRGMSADESAELILGRWNSLLNDDDQVFILGDISMSHPREVECLRYLHGRKTVIGGNHDTPKCAWVMQDLGIPVLGCYEYKDFILTHIPVHPLELTRYRGNIHGHVHIGANPEKGFYDSSLLGRGYYNVNTELHRYTPVSFDTILRHFEALED